MVRLSIAAFTAGASLLLATASAQTPLTTELVVGGLSRPLWVGAAPGDAVRLFVLEQNQADIHVVQNGVVTGTFLDPTGKVATGGNEQGLLGMAFHPQYQTNGFFYVNYTRSGDGATIVERYQVSGNPDVANAASGTTILGPIAQFASNHNGGCIAFNPVEAAAGNHYLYVGTGDGGGAGDSACNAQNGQSLLGKMLRIDVDNGGVAAPGNPFIGNPNFDDRIWAYGLRNPWRFSFDRSNGDLYIGDVGQNAREELNWVPGSSTGGENYGWKMMEGFNCFSTSNCAPGTPLCNDPSLTDPVHDYSHGLGCSVTGGIAYRGCAIPDLAGTYLYADYCSGRMWSFKVQGGSLTNLQERTAELDSTGQIGNVMSFGEDACGEILICDQGGGQIWRVVPASGGNPTSYGTGEIGSQGTEGVTGWTSCPSVEVGAFAVTATGFNPNSFGVVFTGTQTATSAVAWGTILVGGFVTRTYFNTDGNGQASIPVPILASQIGFTRHFQAVVRDPGFGGNVQAGSAITAKFCP
ncbi:MAG: PQQ-dependent sugar dehydrogenase [Planctomycetota bacterium JB042]